ncbi:CehA/McbA family metallohydrolase [Streptomyces acidiscabies]|uniref:CehA/McbA family metallohydrolase n=1 Tax=Streptomyces acidiscabies TaxID=42234 RepID=A0AAP6BCY7_9ACTN|nr:CehA/McbA family metallohydrolase [Streptomyces acidiscabies]MBP5938938.1 phosphoesterase [Streptomyces sp. LBUM 1476]MBZ3910065.1 CehA/McbA family metallohydrolase [Streptomyces acidiscabies]MDX2962460.1 CehA/McbA family metallohydrolase [Streptomyces acidiscabies]MDX3020373.1 CehA/McbA family metallohydrolase [Streptomyces acidiscabies]MDX3789841.1 CehA/McbA family metallohydrolase [Streptomyces acidiscabies]
MCDDVHEIGRRALFVTGTAAVMTVGGVSFASAEGREQGRAAKTLRGTLPTGAPDFVYVPVEVPAGVGELRVAYTYDRPAVPTGTAGNALDIGLFDERGTGLGGRGFRGWSGGARTEFFVRADDATPGYVPGPIRAGTWYVALGPYTVSPQGLTYEITVTLTYGSPSHTPTPVYPPERARGRGRAWYRGDCHLHSWYSDGRRTPAEIAALARTAGLDFINTSEHNTHAGHAHWADQAGDDLLILLGEEVTTRNGHVVALGTDPGTFVDWRYRARENRFARFARQIHRAGGLVVPAHPHATCIGCAWKFGFGEADAVEVWNGPYTPDDEIALASWDATLVAAVREGRDWLPAMGNSDAHRDPDVVGLPQTVVLADDLTRAAIQDGIRAGRSYIAESKDVSLALTVTGPRGEHAGIGERLAVAPDTPVVVHVDVSGVRGCTVRLVTDQGVLFTGAPVGDSGSGVFEWRTTPSYAAYVRAEVRHPATAPSLPGPFAALTNPVFLGCGRD